MSLRTTLVLLAAAAAPAQQDWTDRAEYDLALSVRQEASAAARLPLLATWKQGYPKSALSVARAELTLDAAQALGDRAKVLEAARDLVAADANHFAGLYWLTLLAPATGPAPAAAALAEAEANARRLAAGAPAFFASASAKSIPAKQKPEVLALAQRTLGWVAWQRKDLAAAEKELRASLALAPNQAEISAWLGSVLAVQKAPDRQITAVWHLARASFLDGEGALASMGRSEVRGLLEAVYGNYHGSLDGLDAVGTAARTAVDPPAGFKVETAAELAQRKADEELEKSNPQLLTWMKIKRRITGADAEAQYAKLAEAALPLLKGYVVRCDRDAKPTEVILGLEDSATEEVALKFEVPHARCAEVGTALEFEGKPIAFAPSPFRLTLTAPNSAIQGWPAAGEKTAAPKKD